jgi:arginyl-tRNA synthetase
MIQSTLVEALTEAARTAAPGLGLDPGALPEPELSRPRQKGHGDWATNLALVLAPKAGQPPRQVAEAIAGAFPSLPLVDGLDVAGPGFINIRLKSDWLHDVLREILRDGPAYGLRARARGDRVQVEFVSANPTGPLHVGTARNAALGDAVASILEADGYDVEREYYWNDAGTQMEAFAASVEARYLERFGREAEIPDGGYQGEYVREIAEAIAADLGDSLVDASGDERRSAIAKQAYDRTLEGIRATLARFGITFDSFLSARLFYETGAIDDAVARLREAGHVFEEDGATWFRSTAFGDDKDRVLIRRTGLPTYFAEDCAYVVHKAARGYARMIYVWGADHHGDVKRVLGAAEALGVDPARVEILLYQFVNLSSGGAQSRMSKRAGDVVTLDELIDEVGTDAARYTLLARSSDSTIDFDIEAVTRQTMDNPVFYVQYAHARIASLLRVAQERGVVLPPWEDLDLDVLTDEPELDLLRTLSELPEIRELAAATLAPHRLAHYIEDVAAVFHRFYTECRVITEDVARTHARLWLSAAAKQVIGTSLRLLGVSAPESMERLDDDEAG